jgi:hypothetical protein
MVATILTYLQDQVDNEDRSVALASMNKNFVMARQKIERMQKRPVTSFRSQSDLPLV